MIVEHDSVSASKLLEGPVHLSVDFLKASPKEHVSPVYVSFQIGHDKTPPARCMHGGAGFIGSHLCDLLAQNNWEITILDMHAFRWLDGEQPAPIETCMHRRGLCFLLS